MPLGPFSGPELLIIFIIVLLLLGPKKLPELARGLGEAVREFRKAAQGELETPRPRAEQPKVEPRKEEQQH